MRWIGIYSEKSLEEVCKLFQSFSREFVSRNRFEWPKYSSIAIFPKSKNWLIRNIVNITKQRLIIKLFYDDQNFTHVRSDSIRLLNEEAGKVFFAAFKLDNKICIFLNS